MRRVMVTAALALLCGACGDSAGVRGSMDGTGEQLTGKSQERLGGTGTLTLKTTAGVECSGPFVYKTQREASGTLQCSDGRTGTFDLVSTGTRGSGKGVLGGRPFTITLS